MRSQPATRFHLRRHPPAHCQSRAPLEGQPVRRMWRTLLSGARRTTGKRGPLWVLCDATFQAFKSICSICYLRCKIGNHGFDRISGHDDWSSDVSRSPPPCVRRITGPKSRAVFQSASHVGTGRSSSTSILTLLPQVGFVHQHPLQVSPNRPAVIILQRLEPILCRHSNHGTAIGAARVNLMKSFTASHGAVPDVCTPDHARGTLAVPDADLCTAAKTSEGVHCEHYRQPNSGRRG